MRVSLVINGDTRPGLYRKESSMDKMNEGTRSIDFLIDGVLNKKQFFEDYDHDVTLFIDEHEPLKVADFITIKGLVDDLVMHKHNKHFMDRDYFPDFVGINILNALVQARGDILVHFDWDMAAFRHPDCRVIDQWIEWLMEGKYDYISYPSPWSPSPTDCGPRWGYFWASSRFFMCKRDTIDYTELLKCISDADYMYAKYPYAEQYRKCSWLEHAQGIVVGPNRVFYPPMLTEYMIFSWARYYEGLLNKLNMLHYNHVMNYVFGKCGGIGFPCDVKGVPL